MNSKEWRESLKEVPLDDLAEEELLQDLEAAERRAERDLQLYHRWRARAESEKNRAEALEAECGRLREANILKTVSSEWEHTDNPGEVPCHSRMIEGVLCRWWGRDEPPGVAMIDRYALTQAKLKEYEDFTAPLRGAYEPGSNTAQSLARGLRTPPPQNHWIGGPSAHENPERRELDARIRQGQAESGPAPRQEAPRQ